jgi:hypothetical protein
VKRFQLVITRSVMTTVAVDRLSVCDERFSGANVRDLGSAA